MNSEKQTLHALARTLGVRRPPTGNTRSAPGSATNGLEFSQFGGYEAWQVVAVSQTHDLIEVILANPVTIDDYRAGVPSNGKPIPNDSNMAKIHWKAKRECGGPRSDVGTRQPA